ncbi:nitroreductase family deazaflavin-dependent oxidoreductase [Nocardioides dilutus]
MGLFTPIARRVGAIPWLPKYLTQIVWTDKQLQKLTRGKLTLLDVAGLPNVNLTVRGRKSGIERTTPLLCVPDRDTWLLAGSNFGGPKEPLWVMNLRAAGGEAVIQYQRERIPVIATELEGADREVAWQTMLDVWPNYRLYEARMTRQIPVFRLTRV